MQAFFMSESKEILRLERPDGHREGQGLTPCSPQRSLRLAGFFNDEILRLERPDGHREGQGLIPCSPRALVD